VKKYSVVIVVSLAQFIFALDTTMMNVAITPLTQDLNTEIQNIQLTISLYSLIIACCMLLGAKLASIYGTKRIFIIGAILFGAGTFTASISQDVAMLTLGWALLEGVGAAFMIPTAVTFLMTSYQGKERAVAFSIFTAVTMGAAAIGPIVGGLFTTYLSWRWAFAFELFIVAAILIFSRVLKGQRAAEKPKLDVVGVLLSALGFGCLVMGVIATTNFGWWEAKQPLVIGGMAIAPFGLSIAPVLMFAGAVFLVLLVLWERRLEKRGDEPLMPTSLLKNRTYVAGVTIHILMQLCLAAVLFTIPFFLQSVLYKDALQTGLILMPLTLAMVAAMPLTTLLGTRIPVKYLSLIGTAISAAGAVLLAVSFSVDMSSAALVPGFILFGFGVGLAMGQLQNLSLSSLKPSESDEGAGLLNTCKNLGSSFGTAIVGTLLITFFLAGLVMGINGSSVFPQASKDKMTTFTTQSTLKMERENLNTDIINKIGDSQNKYIQELNTITADAVGTSMRVTYYTLAGILGIGSVVSLFLSKKKLVPSDSDTNVAV